MATHHEHASCTALVVTLIAVAFIIATGEESACVPAQAGLPSRKCEVAVAEADQVSLMQIATRSVSRQGVHTRDKRHREMSSVTKTNGGLFTLQALPSGGLPLHCSIPQCSRSENCTGKHCCSAQMFEALSEITDWMDSNSVEYVVLFGTLLGAHRDKDIIPWTGDIDLGVYKKDVGKLLAQKDIPWNFGFEDSFVVPRGCENHHPGFPGNYSEFVMDSDLLQDGGACTGTDAKFCSYYVDLYVLDSPPHGGRLARNCVWFSQNNGTGHVKNTSVEIRGKRFSAPFEIEDCLKSEYGFEWRTPDPDRRWQGDPRWG